MKGLVLFLVCLSGLSYPVVVLGCTCAFGPVLTDLQEACLDYQQRPEDYDIFSALVVDRKRDDTKCFSPIVLGEECDDPGYNYVIEIVEVFKGNHQVLYFVCYIASFVGPCMRHYFNRCG